MRIGIAITSILMAILVVWGASCDDIGGGGSRTYIVEPDSTGCDTVLVEVPASPETVWVYVAPDTVILVDDDIVACVREILSEAPPYGHALWEAIYACLPAE